MNSHEYWDTTLEIDNDIVRCERDAVSHLKIPSEHRDFLCEIGLPASAAPFLNFENLKKSPLFRIDARGQDGPDMPYVLIGSDGCGDPIVMAQDGTGNILCFNHDNHMEQSFMNSSVICLAECLKAYRCIMRRITDEFPDWSFLDDTYPPEMTDLLERSLRDIDPPAVKEKSYWWHEIQSLRMHEQDSPIPMKPWWKFW